MPSIALLLWCGNQNDWCGHKFCPNHAHPLGLHFILGRTLNIHAITIVYTQYILTTPVVHACVQDGHIQNCYHLCLVIMHMWVFHFAIYTTKKDIVAISLQCTYTHPGYVLLIATILSQEEWRMNSVQFSPTWLKKESLFNTAYVVCRCRDNPLSSMSNKM